MDRRHRNCRHLFPLHKRANNRQFFGDRGSRPRQRQGLVRRRSRRRGAGRLHRRESSRRSDEPLRVSQRQRRVACLGRARRQWGQPDHGLRSDPLHQRDRSGHTNIQLDGDDRGGHRAHERHRLHLRCRRGQRGGDRSQLDTIGLHHAERGPRPSPLSASPTGTPRCRTTSRSRRWAGQARTPGR
jgi:hypothetical protein